MPPFEKVETQVDFPALERDVLAFWERIGAFERLRQKNRGQPKWSFLDGPITANNPMGVHHAWGRTYKDAYQRYFAMTGHELRYQNGFDCQGLWVEVEVEKALKLASKRDIENLVPADRFASIDLFVRYCKERVDEFARVQTNQSIRLGYWMDWDRTDADWAKPPDERKSYFTMSEENNYTIWAFLKKCHSRGLVYRGYDAMPWCARCGVGISQMEMHEGYKLVAHRSIFVRLPLRGRPGENLLVWTTTPWTLTSNVGAAVNPELTYLKVKQGDQLYYVAKGAFKAPRLEEQFKAKEWVDGVPKLKTLEQHFKERSKEGYSVVGEVKGSEMVGWAYDGPFDEFKAQQHPAGYPDELAEVVHKQNWAPDVSAKDAHRVVAWKDVGETEGTGIVHIAPGCGKEDFALGKETGLPPVAPLDEAGVFLPGFGELAGQSALSSAVVEWVLKSLKEKGVLFATEQYPHKYPHCWRCKTELLYRLVDEWFINMSWRGEIEAVTEQATFLPEAIKGKEKEKEWLRNMGDWMISKKRFWGLALPIWVDDNDPNDFEVIGSRQELKERAVAGWPEFDGHTPHRPWIDKVKVRNPRTGNLMSRIPDVGNPWLDAGIVPYSTLGWNQLQRGARSAERGTEEGGFSVPRSAFRAPRWEEWFPADFVTESFPGQFRNWFYSMLAMSAMLTGRAPFKTLLGHASVRDQFGEEMHKSAGNAIEFNGAADTGYTIDHELKPKEQPKQPEGALSFEVIEKDKKTDKGYEKVRAVRAAYPAMGADVIRWLYCRHNPVANLNFGPLTADEVRAKFVLKLWNCYAFFANYARLDGFDPTAAPVPVLERPDLDRWILSDLQLLVRKARESFERFSVMDFCLEAERFVDDKLSNWYVRRNRRRFWKSEQGSDKLAAYQTLYTVLTTLAKLFAPVVPFLTEALWQNLRQPSDPESVHLCDYPTADETLIDKELSDDMELLLRFITCGLAARSKAKIKVRQRLAGLLVGPGSEIRNQVERVMNRFGEQIREELNLRDGASLGAAGDFPLTQTKYTLTRAGKEKFKALAKEVQAKLTQSEPPPHRGLSREKLESESVRLYFRLLSLSPFQLDCPSGPVEIQPGDDVSVTTESLDPEWVYHFDPAIGVVYLNVHITPELAREGKARDVVRQVQELRKKADLDMADRIALHLGTESAELRQAIEEHRDIIARETLTAEWLAQPPAGGETTAVKIDGQPLTIGLRKLER